MRQDALDGGEEEPTEKVTAMGAAAGVLMAGFTAKSDSWPQLKSVGSRFSSARIIPMGLDTICMRAMGFSVTGRFIQRGGIFGAKRSPEAAQ